MRRSGSYNGFTCAGLDTIGNSGRNSNFGPGFFNMDWAIQKNFPIKESLFLQFRMDMFNAFNIVSSAILLALADPTTLKAPASSTATRQAQAHVHYSSRSACSSSAGVAVRFKPGEPSCSPTLLR